MLHTLERLQSNFNLRILNVLKSFLLFFYYLLEISFQDETINAKRKLERRKICEHFNCGDNIISGKNYLFYEKHLQTHKKIKIIGFVLKL